MKGKIMVLRLGKTAGENRLRGHCLVDVAGVS